VTREIRGRMVRRGSGLSIPIKSCTMKKCLERGNHSEHGGGKPTQLEKTGGSQNANGKKEKPPPKEESKLARCLGEPCHVPAKRKGG